MSKRLYHVVVIHNQTEAKTYMTRTPVTHAEGCTILGKLTRYPWRREQLEEATSTAPIYADGSPEDPA